MTHDTLPNGEHCPSCCPACRLVGQSYDEGYRAGRNLAALAYNPPSVTMRLCAIVGAFALAYVGTLVAVGLVKGAGKAAIA